MKTCRIDGCDKTVIAKGLCSKHYNRNYYHGDPLALMRRENGTGSYNHSGYLIVTDGGTKKRLHVLLAEKALGRPLPAGAVVHHVDGNEANNDPANLVICPSHAYHMTLHQRTRSLAASGHASWRKCKFCKNYDAPERMAIYSDKNSFHRSCRSTYIKRTKETKNVIDRD